MSRVLANSDLGKTDDPKEFIRTCSKLLNDIVPVLNGQIEFGDNIKSQVVDVNFTAANTNTKISHGLNQTGLKYFVVKKNVACDVYDGSTDATKKDIYLKCTQIATVKIVLF